MHDVLPIIQSGRFQPAIVTGLTADWDDAAEALLDPAAKVIVTRSG